jgi:hypothetical protein
MLSHCCLHHKRVSGLNGWQYNNLLEALKKGPSEPALSNQHTIQWMSVIRYLVVDEPQLS